MYKAFSIKFWMATALHHHQPQYALQPFAVSEEDKKSCGFLRTKPFVRDGWSNEGERYKERRTETEIQRVARLTAPTADGQRLIDVFELVGTSESLSAWFYKGACSCWSWPCYVFFRVWDREAQTKTTWTMTLGSTPCFWQRASIKHVAQTQLFDRTPWWLRDA